MEIILNPAQLSGKISAPASKSYLQRAIAIAAFTDGLSTIKGYTASNDSDAAIRIVQKLGAKVNFSESAVTIRGIQDFNKSEIEIHCGESGLGSRMFIPLVSIFESQITITGEGSLLKRPLNMVEDALKQLGKKVESKNGFLPFKISGKINNQNIELDGSETSQLLTGLLILMPMLRDESFIKINNLKSKPYIQMTLEILQKFGIKIENQNFESFKIQGNQKPQAIDYQCEGDWSGAAFLIVAAALAGNIELTGLNPHSAQADVAILKALELCGAHFEFNNDGNLIVSKNELSAFYFDATHCPDLFPPLACLAANCQGVSKIKGIHRLIHKESNRIQSIMSEFKKIGIQIQIDGDEMWIEGKKNYNGANTHSHNDHRIAMAMAVMSLNATSPLSIQNADSVNKSYPKFWEDFEKLTK